MNTKICYPKDCENDDSIISFLKSLTHDRSVFAFDFKIGNFVVILEVFRQETTISFKDKYNVFLLEKTIGYSYNEFIDYKYISFTNDIRFINYDLIKYQPSTYDRSSYDQANNGDNMPIPQIIELIKYVNRLSKLTAFT